MDLFLYCLSHSSGFATAEATNLCLPLLVYLKCTRCLLLSPILTNKQKFFSCRFSCRFIFQNLEIYVHIVNKKNLHCSKAEIETPLRIKKTYAPSNFKVQS